jgi:predicted nucleotidyltransferase
MNGFERAYRLFSEAVLLGALYFLVFKDIRFGLPAAFIVAHTTFWIFNGHIFVLLRFLSEKPLGRDKFIRYIEGIRERSEKKRYLAGTLLFGSLSRGDFSPFSDLDVRIIREKSLLGSIRACNYCAFERLRAFTRAFPLDIYVFDLSEISVKMRPDENPVVLSDPRGVIARDYNGETIGFSDFLSGFSVGNDKGGKE